jgi:hypothetical protein
MSVGFSNYVRNKTHWDLDARIDLSYMEAIKLIKGYYKDHFTVEEKSTEFLKGKPHAELKQMLVRVTNSNLLPVPPSFYAFCI